VRQKEGSCGVEIFYAASWDKKGEEIEGENELMKKI
jgi:hypothetical protein